MVLLDRSSCKPGKGQYHAELPGLADSISGLVRGRPFPPLTAMDGSAQVKFGIDLLMNQRVYLYFGQKAEKRATRYSRLQRRTEVRGARPIQQESRAIIADR